MNAENKYVFAEKGNDNHWLGVDICLETDGIDIHDWVALPADHYDNLLPPLRAFIVQIHKSCGGLCLGKSYGESSAVIDARVRHQQPQNNAYDCGIFTSYMLFVASRPRYNRELPDFDLTSNNASFYRLWLLKNLASFYLDNPNILETLPEHRAQRHANTILGNIVPVPLVPWSGTSDCPLLAAALHKNEPFKIEELGRGFDESELHAACSKYAAADTHKYSSCHGSTLTLTITETFNSVRRDNCSRIEHV